MGSLSLAPLSPVTGFAAFHIDNTVFVIKTRTKSIYTPLLPSTSIGNKKEQNPNRFLIEDDYDGEFRFNGKPLPTLQSMDKCDKVIYMNTFTKTLSPTIRISYMVLPQRLLMEFKQKMSFYSYTVPNIDQIALAYFIEKGFFERHINRMRKDK